MENIGWILLFYLDENQQNDREKFPYLSWSPYDRMDIKEITQFNDFFENNYWIRWNGVVQQMHLIPEYPDKFDWHVADDECDEKKDKKQYLITIDDSEQFALNCIITTKFNKKLRNEKALREKVYNALDRLETVNKLSLKWAAFNSLGSESIVFILLADDIETFARFGEILTDSKFSYKDKEETLFSDVSSFVNFNEAEWQGNPKADLIIRLNLKSREVYQPVVKELTDEGISIDDIMPLFLEKCVLDIRIKCNDNILNCFKSEGIFNGESEFYKKYISSSRSYWCILPKKTNSFVIKVDDDDKIELLDTNITEDNYDKKKIEDQESTLLKFVLQEYQRLIKSDKCSLWTPVLRTQYKTVCSLVEYYVKIGDRKQLYSLLEQLTNVLQNIRQACTPVSEVPYHNYTYSGSYNDILSMYYGVIEAFFEVGFQMPHKNDSQQHQIVFCVDFKSASEIYSSMYTSDDDNEQFIVFHLPFNSFSNIDKTVKLLSHEVFHYIAPYDREQRNKLLVESWTKTVLNKVIQLYNKKAICSEIIEKIILQLWNCEELYSNAYKCVTEKNHGIEGCILNDFIIEGENLHSLSQALDQVSVNIIKKIQKLILEVCNESKAYANLKGDLKDIEETVRNEIKTDITNKYIQTEIVKNAKAYKEVFCDLCMIYLFEMDLNDYISWFYNISFKKFEKFFVEEFNLIELEKKNIRIISCELRMCIIFDMFCGKDDPNDSYKNFKISTDKLLSKKEITDGLRKFVEYCNIFYSQYLNEKNLFRNLYQRFFSETLGFWRNLPNSVLSLKRDFSETKNINNNISLSIKVINLFISKYFIKDFKKTREMLKSPTTPVITEKPRILCNLSLGEEYCVTSIADYISAVCEKTKNMRKDSAVYGASCWYRGICDRGHSLLPGLYRLYGDEKKNNSLAMSPYVKQAEILKDAYYLTMSMPSLWTEQLQGISEHMCCLQHYGMITNLLDFSLDMLVALHFALNPDDETDRKELANGNYFPKVVIFNPAKYNKAIMSLKNGYINTDSRRKIPSPVLFDVCNDEMSDYFVSVMTPEKFSEMNREFFENAYKPCIRKNQYPVPVIIRQSNSRILAQNGIFLAYSLYAKVDKDKHDFSYLDLRQIQKEYLLLFKNQKNLENEKFLEEIAIEPSCVRKLQNELKIMGINTGKMYPELTKIFEQYRSDKKHFN